MLFCKIEMNTYTPKDLQSFADSLADPLARTRKESAADKHGRKESRNEGADNEEITDSMHDDIDGAPSTPSSQPKNKMRLAKKRTRQNLNQ